MKRPAIPSSSGLGKVAMIFPVFTSGMISISGASSA
jgi:hypothetical protein